MSADIKNKKRKSGDDVVPAAKKAKTAKSADRPAPLKSALKTAKVQTTVVTKTKTDGGKGKKSKIEVIAVERPEKVAKSKKAKVVEKQAKVDIDVQLPEQTAEAGAEEDNSELSPDQTAALLAGFSSDDEEASDNEGIEISKLPAAPTTGEVQKRIKQAATGTSVIQEGAAETGPGVIYISRIPHGFFEKQMRAYFSQFGDITNLRLARNKRTGKSQHYAFVEFKSGAVADIVAKTMDKYLLFGHILQVKRVPREQVKEGLWKGAHRSRPMPRNRMEGTKLKQGMVREEWDKKITKEEAKRLAKQEQLRELGYEFEMPKMKSVTEVPVKEKAVEAVVDNNEHGATKGDVAAEDKGTAAKQDEIAKLIEYGEATQQQAEKPKSSDAKLVKEKVAKRKSVKEAVPVAKKTKKVKVSATT